MLSYIKDIDLVKDYLVVIYSPANNHYITGIIEDEDISIPASANLSDDAVGNLAQVASNSILNSILGRKLTDAIRGFASMGNFKTVAQTMIAYDEPQRTNITVQMKIFPNVHGNGNVKKIIESCTFFTQYRKDSVVGRIAPNLYSLENVYKIAKDQIKNGNLSDFDPLFNQLVSFSVGEVINTDGVFFVENVTPSICSSVDDTNTPLYVKATFNLTSYRAMTAEEIAGWIKV